MRIFIQQIEEKKCDYTNLLLLSATGFGEAPERCISLMSTDIKSRCPYLTWALGVRPIGWWGNDSLLHNTEHNAQLERVLFGISRTFSISLRVEMASLRKL